MNRKLLLFVFLLILIIFIFYIYFYYYSSHANKNCSLCAVSPPDFQEKYEYPQNFLPYSLPYIPENQQLPTNWFSVSSAQKNAAKNTVAELSTEEASGGYPILPDNDSFMYRRDLPGTDSLAEAGPLYQYQNNLP